VPLELECKASNHTLLSVRDNLIKTLSVTDLPIDIHPNPNVVDGFYIPYMNPQSIRFAQKSISRFFRNGMGSLEDIIEGPGRDSNYRTQFPPIKVTLVTPEALRNLWPYKNLDKLIKEYPAGLYTLDNRRLFMYKRLYASDELKTIPIVLVNPNHWKVEKELKRKLNTKSGGEKIKVSATQDFRDGWGWERWGWERKGWGWEEEFILNQLEKDIRRENEEVAKHILRESLGWRI
jgi:hypothetical protein